MEANYLAGADPVSQSASPVLPPEPASFQSAVRYKKSIQTELASILGSTSFRGSKKSCEFLQYVVHVALDGRTDSLKERSIGLDLLGRDTSYDPSSDATVRVRAVEVRKRLTSFYSTHPSTSGYRIELSPGSYVPRFVKEPPPPLFTLAPQPNLPAIPQPLMQASVPPFSVVKMVRPSLIALFFCAFFLRQQIQTGDSYHQFWDKRLRGKSVVLLSLDETKDNLSEPEAMLQAVLPLVWLAGRYDLRPVVQPFTATADNIQTAKEGDAITIRSAETTPSTLLGDTRLRYRIERVHGTSRLVDGSRAGASTTSRAALLTVLPEVPSVLWITGTDLLSLNKLATMISSRNDFPAELTSASEAGSAVQAVLYLDPSPHLEFDRH